LLARDHSDRRRVCKLRRRGTSERGRVAPFQLCRKDPAYAGAITRRSLDTRDCVCPGIGIRRVPCKEAGHAWKVRRVRRDEGADPGKSPEIDRRANQRVAGRVGMHGHGSQFTTAGRGRVLKCSDRQGVFALPFDDHAGFTAPAAFGPFRVLHQIGSGVLGPVFRTFDPRQEKLVAVKAFRLDVVPETSARLAEILKRMAAAPVKHPAVVGILDAGLEGTTGGSTSGSRRQCRHSRLRGLALAPCLRRRPFAGVRGPDDRGPL